MFQVQCIQSEIFPSDTYTRDVLVGYSSHYNVMKRKLYGVERAMWKRDSVSLNIVLSATLSGSLHSDDLAEAWTLLQQKHPMLQAYLEEEDQVFLSFHNKEKIQVREVRGGAENCLEKELIRELETPFDPIFGQLLIRSTLVHFGKNVELILTCHHCISDALSVAYLLRDVLYCLSGQEERVPRYEDRAISRGMLPADFKLPYLMRGGIAVANFFLGQLMPPMRTVKKTATKKSDVLVWSISKEQTAGFVDVCKRNGVTVHAAVSTLFQAAQQNVQGLKSIYKKIYTPVNIRSRLRFPVGENFGLFVSEAYIPSRYDPEKSFWDNVQTVHKTIKQKTTDANILGLPLINECLKPEVLDRISVFLMKKMTSCYFGYLISNLGKLNFPEFYGGLQLKAMHGPVIYIPQAEKTLTLLTLNQQMFFTFTYQPAVISKEKIVSIRDNAMELLEKYSHAEVSLPSLCDNSS